MTNVDQFESTFRSASKPVFSYEPVNIGSVLVITDLEEYEAQLLADRVRACLPGFGGGVIADAHPATDAPPHPPADPHPDPGPGVAWRIVHGTDYRDVPSILAIVERERPDLICTYRHLYTEGWKWPFTLGDHLEVLTQAVPTPVLVVPHPRSGRAAEHALVDMNTVMAITDHLTGDSRLVNYGLRFTDPGGRLFLTHVEDDAAFERFLTTIGKVPELDTDVAREVLPKQLLKEPRDFIRSCRTILEAKHSSITIEEIVTIGHHLSAYTRLVDEHEVDLLVANTKDEDQMAMHGLAYPLAIELRKIPMLML